MAVLKCKMCGGTLNINVGDTVAVCEYCETKQTLPKLDDEKRIQLYDRANYFRRENEFDKAMGVYEMILSDASGDSESYWGIVLCRYGIEYVEDPASGKRIPTVNRAQYTSIFDDDNYQKAIQYADALQREVYEEEAKEIDRIQKGILEISNKEDPFDIFICYKETDSLGNRTQDSVYAQDIYYALTKEGFKVFFSRITLENKLGSAYEPYIFAALNSAKVMLVVGTSKDNLNAVWVKNEWSRYLSLIKTGSKKSIIPVYKDMSPYDMPEEFKYLQSQDMSKIGFLQDLIHGVNKLVGKPAPQVQQVSVADGTANTETLLKRIKFFLEDGDFGNAKAYCERVLDNDPENATAYLYSLMVELRAKSVEELQNVAQPFDGKNSYQKAIRFGDNKMKEMLSSYNESIKARNELARIEGVYAKAQEKMQKGGTEAMYKDAAKLFESISDYKDSEELAKNCYEYAECARKDACLKYAKSAMERSNYDSALTFLKQIPGWREADQLTEDCHKGIQEKKEKEEKRRQEIERRVGEVTRKAPKIVNILLAAGIGSAVISVIIAILSIVMYIINYM